MAALIFGSESYPVAFAQVGPTESLNSPVANQYNSNSLIVEPGTQLVTSSPVQMFDQTVAAAEAPSISPSDELPYLHEIIPHPLDQSKLVSVDDHNIKDLEPEAVLPTTLDLYDLSLARYTMYRYEEDVLRWMPGDGEQFGWLSFESPNYLSRNEKSGITANMNFHLLSGPQSVHLPPRLYDFEMGYQSRNTISDLFSYDWSAMVGIYSDFEDSARDGVRFPAHVVGMLHPGPRADWIFGIDYLDRDDIQMLPVFGMCWHDPERPEWRYELVFPRPRIDWTLSEQSRVYWSGALGGGTWDIEFPDNRNDVMTYRDYQLAFGIEQADEDGGLNSWEIGWNFSRKLEFRDYPADVGFGDALTIRFVKRN